MARNRMIKPEFWSSETLMKVSRDSRLLFIGLWNFCDDFGFCLNSTRKIIGDVFPLDDGVTEANIKKWLIELIEINVVIPVEYKSKKLLFMKSWGEHQSVQHKSKRSFVDSVDLEQVIKDSLESHEDLMKNYLESHAPKLKKKDKDKDKVKDNYVTWNKGRFWDEMMIVQNRRIEKGEKAYSEDFLKYFYFKMTEETTNGNLKFQEMKSWSTGGRLSTWASNGYFNGDTYHE